MNNDKTTLEYIEDLVKENLLKFNKEEIKIIPIQPTPLNGSQGFLDYFKNIKIEVNNSLAIPMSLLGKATSSKCLDDKIDSINMMLNLERKSETKKIKLNVLKNEHLKYHL